MATKSRCAVAFLLIALIILGTNTMLNGAGEKKGAENMTHAETVAALRGLGITIPEKLVEETEAFMASQRAEWAKAGLDVPESADAFAANLLMSAGIGEYDYDTGAWTPGSSDVYAFDAEVFDIDNMYGLYFQGLSAIIPGFEPTDIHESIEECAEDGGDDSEEDGAPAAEGTTTVSFALNGEHYEWELDFYGDWFNEKAIALTNDVLAQQGFKGRIHTFTDGMQGVMLFYGDEAYGEKLREIIPQMFPEMD